MKKTLLELLKSQSDMQDVETEVQNIESRRKRNCLEYTRRRLFIMHQWNLQTMYDFQGIRLKSGNLTIGFQF